LIGLYINVLIWLGLMRLLSHFEYFADAKVKALKVGLWFHT
jgi:hypothetical protein